MKGAILQGARARGRRTIEQAVVLTPTLSKVP